MRVYELAKFLGVPSRWLVEQAELPSHLSVVDTETEIVLRELNPKPARTTRKMKRRPGPKRISFEPSSDYEYSDPRRDLQYEPIWSTRDVAFYFGVKPATVRQWVRRGHIKPDGSEGPSHVFRSQDVMDAYESISARTRRSRGSNVRTKFHDRQVSCEVAARACGVAPSTVRSWISRGHVRSVRDDGGHVTVRVGDVFRLARRSSAVVK